MLKVFLNPFIEEAACDKFMYSGLVNYGYPLKLLPFNKRPIFKNENEVRFAFRPTYPIEDYCVDVSSIFEKFGLRFSPDAPKHHRDAVFKLWIENGGNKNKIQFPYGD